tara:strand:- start:731 stop:2785 length:2055 start_codon:yes stop_codon:yes gene_type:complete
VANTPLNIDVKVNGQRQIDNLQRSLGRTTKSTIDLGSALRLAGAAFAAIGIGRFAKSIVGVGRQVENLQLRFKFLFNSAEEGAKAFDTLTEFAGTVPFSLEEIAAASGNLAVVSEDAEQLRENLQLTANVAAISGLDFQTAGEQIQRALSGGISAADLLRERGIKALLGFKDGVKVTTEETQEAFNRVFGPDGTFGNAAVAMANTFDGLASMVGDKFFNIKRTISDSGPFDTLKATVSLLDKAMTKNFDQIKKAAEGFGEAIVLQAKLVLIGAGQILDALQPVTNFLTNAFNNIVRATNGLPGIIKTLGVIGFLALGIKGKLVVALVAGIADKVVGVFADMTDFIAKAKNKVADFYDAIGFDDAAENLRRNSLEMQNEADALRKKFSDLGDEGETAEVKLSKMMKTLEENPDALGKNTKAFLKLIKATEKEIEALKKTEKAINDTIPAGMTQESMFKKLTFTVKDFNEAFVKTFSDMVEKFNPVQEAVDLLVQGFNTFKKGVGDAFADAILGAKNLSQALGELAQQLAKQLISGIIQLGLQVFVFDRIRTKLEEIRDAQNKLNSSLKTEIGLRTILAFLTGGTSLALPGRASGGPVSANAPVVVGERGPEIFVPNASGTVIPNSELGLSADTRTGDITENINVTFNITTLDAADFNQLLESRQDLIIGLINRGLAERGKRSLTA